MDTVSIVSITVGGIALLTAPMASFYGGWRSRGKAADEADKRHAAEKNLWERELTEQKAIVETKEKALQLVKSHMDEIITGVTENAAKINEREKILADNNSASPDDIALQLLRGKAAGSGGTGSSNPSTNSTPKTTG